MHGIAELFFDTIQAPSGKLDTPSRAEWFLSTYFFLKYTPFFCIRQFEIAKESGYILFATGLFNSINYLD